MLSLHCIDDVIEIAGSLRVRVRLLEPARTPRQLLIGFYDAVGAVLKNWEYVWDTGLEELTVELTTPPEIATGLHLVCARYADSEMEATDQVLILSKQQMRDRQHVLKALSLFTFRDSGAIEHDLDVERLAEAAEELTEAGCYRASAGVWLRISSHWLPISGTLAAHGAAQILINYYAEECLPINGLIVLSRCLSGTAIASQFLHCNHQAGRRTKSASRYTPALHVGTVC